MNDRLPEWRPSPEEVAAILVEMQPIIEAFARRDRRAVSTHAA